MLKDYLAFTGILLATSISLLSQQPPAPAAGAPSAGRPPQAPLQIPNPHYVTIPMTIDVSAPAEKVVSLDGENSVSRRALQFGGTYMVFGSGRGSCRG